LPVSWYTPYSSSITLVVIYYLWVARLHPVYWAQALVTMIRSNTVLQEIHCCRREYDVTLFEELVVSRLEMNRSYFEEQCTALKKAHIVLRPKLLGRALAVLRCSPSMVFKFLSDNADVVATAKGGNSRPPRLQRSPRKRRREA
jgi:hypothetical protein